MSAAASATKRTIVPALNRMTVELTNGAVITLRTVSPRPYLKVTRDSYNNPLWSASGIDTVDDDSGRLARFNEKFGMASNDAWGAQEEGAGGFASLVADFGAPSGAAKKKSK
ncbi:ribosomal protein L31 [Allomyces macrogynus ATCC 38327]|uniref:Large ribosomal subunit protein bL31c n=1 Tax=Allomyces macrogynus (strain ATCC 38327) TaxID=578462 RepID=A0A0L0STH8_ALLM3|nr:hypothetical protein GGF32_004812 [Allomyces javanicus]KAJ3368106.1 hypothetical protein GGF31_006813 [Allomyces arbusculus]KNE65827.1 ribosomal protein L31 [Allomyces macrogynus ATCC 38327]|eukprot:KNE65827.1 ribosomal protein L31 [Allomyces macrogynus ATCC 38327]